MLLNAVAGVKDGLIVLNPRTNVDRENIDNNNAVKEMRVGWVQALCVWFRHRLPWHQLNEMVATLGFIPSKIGPLIIAELYAAVISA